MTSFSTMDVTQRKVSGFQVITTDYSMEIIAIFIMILPIVYFFSRLADRPQAGTETFFIKFAVGLLIIGVIRAWWKLRKIKRIFDRGIEVIGTVTNISVHKYKSITYSYTYHQRIYSTVEYIVLTQRARLLKVGSQVVVLVNATNLRQAVIRDFYISDKDFEQNFSEFERLSTNTSIYPR